jgi:hypothetical protein
MKWNWARWPENLPALLVSLVLIPPAIGQEIRNVTVGWGDALRLGRWTPVFVTVADPQPREIDLQIHGSYGEKSASLWLHQIAVAEPQPDTYCLLFPINAQPSRIEVIVSDLRTGRTLGTRALQNNSSFSSAGRMPMRLLAPQDTLIGLSGNIDDAIALQAQLQRADIPVGTLDPLRLPANFAGYDGVSALILAAPDLDQIKPEQEQAILQWVASGGNLLLIPPTTPVPRDDPLIAALPCVIGSNALVNAPTKLNARELSPKPGSTVFQIINRTGYIRWLGLGKIAVVPVNISPLKFADGHSANDFWKSLLQPLAKVPPITEPTSLLVSDVDEMLVPGPNAAQSVGRGQRESDAILHVLQLMGATESSRGIDWRSTLLCLAGFCFLLGPIDSIILMRLGQRPRNWLTLLSWAALIASLGGFAVAREIKSTPSISTFRLVDQMDDSVVAATDIIALNSGRPVLLPLSLDKSEWWEPANQAAHFFSPDRFLDANFHEDKTGCRPEWVRLNGIEPQAWHGEAANRGPGLLRADLRLERSADHAIHLIGKLTNAATTAMTDTYILTASGNFEIGEPLAAGASVDLDQLPVSDPISFPGLPADITDLSPERADRIEELVKFGQAEVICQMPDAVDLKVGPNAQLHWQILRAVLPISK